MARRFRIQFDPNTELFRWGPIPGRLLSISHWVEIFSDYPQRFHHYVWPPTLILIQRKKILAVGEMRALESVGANVFRDLITGKRYQRGWAEYRRQTAFLFEQVRVIESLEFRAVNETDLMRRWVTLSKVIRRWWVYGVIPELGGYGGQALLAECLRTTGLTGTKFQDAYATLAATGRPSFYQEEELALAQLLRLRPGSVLERAALSRHSRQYSWIGNSYFRTHEEPLATFERRLRALRRKHASFRGLRSKLVTYASDLRRKQLRIIRGPRNTELRRISEGVGRCVWWQDQRKAAIFRYLAAVDRMTREIERRAEVPRGTFDNAYFWEVALRPTARLLRLINGRQHGFASHFTGKPGADYPPRDARSIIRRLWNPKQVFTRELAGIPTYASKAPVRAPVFIIESHNDLVRFPKGAVLVAAMTAPEYVVAMRRASAIVTDTGGITSHAAIVSRELKKPCIVGTKYATQVLKNGEMIEVDASQGVVRKLNHARQT